MQGCIKELQMDEKDSEKLGTEIKSLKAKVKEMDVGFGSRNYSTGAKQRVQAKKDNRRDHLVSFRRLFLGDQSLDQLRF